MKNLNEMSSKELKVMAKELKVKNWWNLNKAQLIAGIEEINKASQPEQIKKVEQPEKIEQPELKVVTNESPQPASNLIIGGKKGITNFQMIPAIKQNIGNQDLLVELYNTNPEVFKSSVKYLPDNMKVIGQTIINRFDPEFKVKMGKKMAI